MNMKNLLINLDLKNLMMLNNSIAMGFNPLENNIMCFDPLDYKKNKNWL